MLEELSGITATLLHKVMVVLLLYPVEEHSLMLLAYHRLLGNGCPPDIR